MIDSTASSGDALLDVNTASAPEISALDGIGASVAQRIVEYRHEYGPFDQMADLLHVPGVGEKLLERLKTQIRIGMPPPLTSDAPASEVQGPVQQEDTATVAQSASIRSDARITVDPTASDGAKTAHRRASAASAQAAQVARTDLRQARSIWESLLLVVTAGILGAAIALVVAMAWPGALGLASQAELNALTLDLDAVRTDNDMLRGQLADLVGSVSSLQSAMSEASSNLSSAQDDLADLQSSVTVLRSDMETALTSLENRTISSLGDLQEQLDRTRDDITQMDDALTDVQVSVEAAGFRIQEFDAFFGALYAAMEGLGLPSQ